MRKGMVSPLIWDNAVVCCHHRRCDKLLSSGGSERKALPAYWLRVSSVK